ncbi:membrane hypothetical protein [Azospirillaceae bacterium]
MKKAVYVQKAIIAVISFVMFVDVNIAHAGPAMVERQDYFISADTVIIGCTSGAAAGALAGAIPVFGALISGTGLAMGTSMAIRLTGLGCSVGMITGAVAVLTAWLLDERRSALH